MQRTSVRTRLGATALVFGVLLQAGIDGCSSSGGPGASPSTDAGTSDGPGADGATGGQPNVPGKYPITIDLDGSKREFIVYVPEKAKGATKVPVVFMLHGTSGSGEDFFGRSQWKEVADAEGLIAVFPTALTYCYLQDSNHDGTIGPDELEVFTKWAAGQLGTAERPQCGPDRLAKLSPDKRALADHPLRDDVKFFDTMIDYLNANHSVDPKRVYASGFSNGAEMTGRLANDRPNRFAAIALASSAMSVAPVAQTNPITVVFTLGSVDEEQGPRVGGNPVPLAESQITNPAFASSYVAPMLTMLQLDKSYTYSTPTVAGKKTGQWLFAKSTIGKTNTFRAVVIEDVAHEYPNGMNHPVRLAPLLWDVFKTTSLP